MRFQGRCGKKSSDIRVATLSRLTVLFIPNTLYAWWSGINPGSVSFNLPGKWRLAWQTSRISAMTLIYEHQWIGCSWECAGKHAWRNHRSFTQAMSWVNNQCKNGLPDHRLNLTAHYQTTIFRLCTSADDPRSFEKISTNGRLSINWQMKKRKIISIRHNDYCLSIRYCLLLTVSVQYNLTNVFWKQMLGECPATSSIILHFALRHLLRLIHGMSCQSSVWVWWPIVLSRCTIKTLFGFDRDSLNRS